MASLEMLHYLVIYTIVSSRTRFTKLCNSLNNSMRYQFDMRFLFIISLNIYINEFHDRATSVMHAAIYDNNN